MTTLEIEVEDSRPVATRCDFEHLEVTLADGRVLQTPLWWHPRLAKASAAARSVIELTPVGLHRPQIDEDISIASMLRGQKAPGVVPPARAASSTK